jgi:plasmid stabilization system protein ParE
MVEQAVHIGKESATHAARFLDAVETTLKQLEEMPGIGRLYGSENPRLLGLRVYSVKDFPKHRIFYREAEDGIVFVHLLHGASDFIPV